tara:strand:- start:430 stop:2466 length:2037 start_codon:yes stop_codon:yes gene_type:complete
MAMRKLEIFAVLLLYIISFTTTAQEEFKSNLSVEELKEAPVKLMPYPKEVSWGEKPIDFKQVEINNFNFLHPSVKSELEQLLFKAGVKTSKNNKNKIKFKKIDSLTREAYTLEITSDEIKIGASSDAGFFYALKTLEQIVDGKKGFYAVKIWDEPAFELRGYMIDTGRNFQPIETLKNHLDILANYKLNTFHWHLTDYPAWRIESKKYPELNAAENHRPTRDPGLFYTYNEIREVINYANELQIQVIPEIDMPGHSDSFTTATGHRMESEEGIKILEDVLYEFFEEIPKEMAPIIHLGSDEVDVPDPEGFMNRMLHIIESNNTSAVIWDPGLPANDRVIRQTWRPEHEIEKMDQSGLRGIDSQNSYINNSEPMLQIPRLLFKPIGQDSNHKIIGGIIALWPDVNLDEPFDAVRHNPLYLSLLTYAWTTWTADITETSSKFITRVPPKNSKAHDYFSAFEDFLMYHKNTYFKGQPFQYVKQADTEWKLIGPFEDKETLGEIKDSYSINDSILQWKNATGNTVYIRDRFKQGGFYPKAKPGETYFAHTYIYADEAKNIPVWIGFETPFRSNRAYTGIPEVGEWDVSGGTIWVHEKEIPAPNWKNPGWKPEKTSGWGSKGDQEVPWKDEELYWTREPAKISLKEGWNEVLIRVPGSSDYQNWMFSFAPLEQEGIRFSTSKN